MDSTNNTNTTTNNADITFTERLKLLRTERGMNMTTLAKNIGISKQAIHNIENGKSEPSLYTTIKLAQFFECSLDELVFGKITFNTQNIDFNLEHLTIELDEIEKLNIKLTQEISDLKQFVENVNIKKIK